MGLRDKEARRYYKNNKFTVSFRNAFNGIRYAWLNERNMKIHSVIALLVVVSGIVYHFTAIEWSIILLCIGIVVALECVNTAIESTVDLVMGDEKHPLAAIAKDVAAGAVLVAAIMSAIIGLIIIVNKI